MVTKKAFASLSRAASVNFLVSVEVLRFPHHHSTTPTQTTLIGVLIAPTLNLPPLLTADVIGPKYGPLNS